MKTDQAIEQAAHAIASEVLSQFGDLHTQTDCQCWNNGDPCDFCKEVNFWEVLIQEAIKKEKQ